MKKNGKASVLSRQKPRRSGRAKLPRMGAAWRLLRWLLALLAVALLAWWGLRAGRREWRELMASRSGRINWKVDLRLDAEHPLSDRKAEEIVRLAKDVLETGRQDELKELAAAVQHLDAFGQTHVLRVARDRIVVSVRPRVPVMCAEVDRLRLVSEAGEIYGVAGVDGAPTCPGPRLVGVVPSSEKIRITPTQTLHLEPDGQTAVKEAIALVQEGTTRGFTFSLIEFRRYRGFFAHVSGLETEVALGRAPFVEKLDKLRALLDKLAARGEVAARIELDYQGKAFVKLKKL